MADIVVEIIDQSEVRETKDGYEAVRVAKVSGLDGTTAGAVLLAALNSSGLPARGEAHPDIPGLFLDTRQAYPEQGDRIVRVVMTYRPLSSTDIADGGKPVMSVGVTLVSEVVHRDASGKLQYKKWLVIEYNDDGSKASETTMFRLCEFELQKPQVVVTYRRRVTRDPAKDAVKFVGKVGEWGRSDPYTARWRCTGIRSNPVQGSDAFDGEYEFTWRPEGWCGRIPRTIRTTDATGTPDLDQRDWLVPLYQDIDFTPLGLPRPPDVPAVDIHGDPAPKAIPVSGPDA